MNKSTTEFAFKIGVRVFDDTQEGAIEIEIVEHYRDWGVNSYKCKTDSGDMVFRKESELI